MLGKYGKIIFSVAKNVDGCLKLRQFSGVEAYFRARPRQRNALFIDKTAKAVYNCTVYKRRVRYIRVRTPKL